MGYEFNSKLPIFYINNNEYYNPKIRVYDLFDFFFYGAFNKGLLYHIDFNLYFDAIDLIKQLKDNNLDDMERKIVINKLNDILSKCELIGSLNTDDFSVRFKDSSRKLSAIDNQLYLIANLDPENNNFDKLFDGNSLYFTTEKEKDIIDSYKVHKDIIYDENSSSFVRTRI